MSPMFRALLLYLPCIFGCISAEYHALNDELSLIQDHQSVRQRLDRPDMGVVLNRIENAMDSPSKAANKVNVAVKDSLVQAANATASAILSVVTTVNAGLDNSLKQNQVLGNHTKDAINGFLGEVEHKVDLQTFEKAGVGTLDAYKTSLIPFVSALNISANAIQSVLKAAGFLHLSQEVGRDLSQAVATVNATCTAVTHSREILVGLGAKVNKSDSKISVSIQKDLDSVNTMMKFAMLEVNTTFIDKYTQAFDLLASHLRATVEGVLPDKYFDDIDFALSTIRPKVDRLAHLTATPGLELRNGFKEATMRLHESLPVDKEKSGAARFVLFVPFVACISASWFML